MIEAYTVHTPNGRKLAITLEETGLPYRARRLDIAEGEQHAAWFRRLNPNGKIPVIRDTDTERVVWESGPKRTYIADAYPIADIALLPWIRALQKWGLALGDFSHLDRWYARLAARPAVVRGFAVPTSSRRETAAPATGDNA